MIGLLCLTLALGACGSSDLEERQADVAEAGSMVMPFDLDATTLEGGGRRSGPAGD